MTFAFQVLGQIGVRRDGRAVELPAGKPRSLLAALLLYANRLVPVETLVDALWDDSPPRSAVANVRTYAVRIRRLLADPDDAAGSRLLGRDGAYRIVVRPGELDLTEFTELAAQGRAALRAGETAQAAQRLGAALDRWPEHHAALGLVRVGGLGRRLAALDAERLRTAEDLVDARLALDHHEALVAELRRTVVEHPLRERSWGQLMRALYRAGDVSGALQCFLTARRALRDEIGVDPGPELQRLHAAILARDPALSPAGVVARRPRQLPPGPPVLFGREEPLAAAVAAVDAGARVVCVCGPPGVGTSAFGVQLARRLAARCPDGQLFVRLGETSAATAAAQLLRGLGEQAPPGLAARSAHLRTAYAGRRVLLLVDGVDDVAQVRPLLPADPGCLTIVVASRTLSTLDGVAVARIGPLTPDDAAALLRHLGAPPELAPACDGLPLALRIVAARWPYCPGYAERLRNPHQRLDALALQDLSVRASIAARFATVGPAPVRDELVDAQLMTPDGAVSSLVRLYATRIGAVPALDTVPS